MKKTIVLDPGKARLDDWRQIYFGAKIKLVPQKRRTVDAASRPPKCMAETGKAIYGVDAGASARIESIDLRRPQNRGLPSGAAATVDALPGRISRLALALKIVRLAQRSPAVRWELFDPLAQRLQKDIVPKVPCLKFAGASDNPGFPAHMTDVRVGIGDCRATAENLLAVNALGAAGAAPFDIGAADLSTVRGTEVSKALALAALFDTEVAFNSALVVDALSTVVSNKSLPPFDEPILQVRRQHGEKDVLTTLNRLLRTFRLKTDHAAGPQPHVPNPYKAESGTQIMGACLDLLREAAAVLEAETSSVCDRSLVFTEAESTISDGNFYVEPTDFAADLMALAISEIGSLSERRLAALIGPTYSHLPAPVSPTFCLTSAQRIAQIMAGALASENRQKVYRTGVDAIPISAYHSDHLSMATHGIARLDAMARNLESIIGIELIAAAHAIYLSGTRILGPELREAVRVIRTNIEPLTCERYLAPDLERAADIVRSSELIAAFGRGLFPNLIETNSISRPPNCVS